MPERLPSLARILEERGPFGPDSMDPDESKASWTAFRDREGMGPAGFVLPGSSNTKLAKSGIATLGLTLLPADASGLADLCVNATKTCRKACVLMTAGKGTLASVRNARLVRTRFLAEFPEAAISLMFAEIRKEANESADLLVRLNVASDLPWERIAPDLFTIPGARFYDYTKVTGRLRGSLPDSYRLVFSFSEAAHAGRVATDYMSRGGTTAVVFSTKRGKPLPDMWRGFPVIDGDESDDRTADPRGVVVGLRAKGLATRLPVGGFIQDGSSVPVSV